VQPTASEKVAVYRSKATNQTVVIKQVPLCQVRPSFPSDLQSRIPQQLKHPALVPILQFHASADTIYLVSEFQEGFTAIQDLKEELSDKQLLSILKQLLSVLHLYEEKNKAFGAIRPSKVLI
jgi:serine/threonine protein kinase